MGIGRSGGLGIACQDAWIFTELHFRSPNVKEHNDRIMKSSYGPWRTEDFDSLAWHDVHVHGFHFASFNEGQGTANLVVDVDYILNWSPSGIGFEFTVCPANLVFHEVFGLKVELDYATPGAGMCPFSVHGIERTLIESPTGSQSYRWRIPINWPYGSIVFDAPDFTLTLTGMPAVQSSQWLRPEQRERPA
jgi:hypothetical protein